MAVGSHKSLSGGYCGVNADMRIRQLILQETEGARQDASRLDLGQWVAEPAQVCVPKNCATRRYS
jgi:hypothetical protein